MVFWDVIWIYFRGSALHVTLKHRKASFRNRKFCANSFHESSCNICRFMV